MKTLDPILLLFEENKTKNRFGKVLLQNFERYFKVATNKTKSHPF